MSDVKKIATRDSYGNALVELGKEHENLVVWMLTQQLPQRLAYLRKYFRNVTLTAELQNVI